MLQVVSKILCFPIMYFTGYFVIKRIVGAAPPLTKRTLIYIMLLGIVSVLLRQEDYAIVYTIIIFLLNIVVYKKVFQIYIFLANYLFSVILLMF